MDDPSQHPISLELPQLLGQHLLRGKRDGSLEMREAERFAPEKMEQDHELPSTLKDANGLHDADSCRVRRVRLITHG